MSRLSNSEKEFVSSQMPLQAEPAPAAPAAEARADNAHVIDARGISPPLPLLRAHRALRAMQPGQILKVITNAPQAVDEFQAMAKFVVGYELVSQEQKDGDTVHLLRRRR
jgi:tRNA 2-thiouridine synthesizing protein A